MKLKNSLLDKFLSKNLDIFLNFNFKGILYLTGGAVRDLLFLNKKPKDIDFVILTQEKNNIKNFIKENKLKYTLNSFGNYKISYNNFEIDIWSTNDLYKTMQYNLDGLFYDIKNKSFIVFGFFKALEKRKLIELNPIRHPIKKRRKERKNKLKDFLKIYKN